MLSVTRPCHGVLRASLNRPERRNAIEGRLLEGLLGTFAEPDAQAVVLCSVGRGRALELCLSMRRVDASEALRLGLVDRLEADPDEAALSFAREIAALDAGAVKRCKQIIGRAAACSEALALERQGNLGWNGELESAASGVRA